MNLASLKFDTGLTGLRVSVIRRGSDVNLMSELQYSTIFRFFIITDCCIILFAVQYSSNPLSKKCHFGHVGGADPNLTFVLQEASPVFALKSRECRGRHPSMLTF